MSPDPSPLMGLSKDRPFIDIRFECPLPGIPVSAHARLQKPPSARICHVLTRSALAVPPGFDGLLHSSATGLLRPAADHGVHYVAFDGREIIRCFLPDCSARFSTRTLPSCHWNSRSVRPRFPPWATLRRFPLHPGRATPPCWSSLKAVASNAFLQVFLGLLPRACARTSLRLRPADDSGRSFDPPSSSGGVRIRPSKWSDSAPSPLAVAPSLCFIRLLLLPGDCSRDIHKLRDDALRRRSTSGF